MSAVELIGFIISLLALIFLFFQNQRRLNQASSSEEFQEEEVPETDPIQALFKELEQEKNKRQKAKAQPPPAPPVPKKMPVASKPKAERKLIKLQERQPLKAIEHEEEKKQLPSYARVSIGRLKHLQDLVIYKEILDKPKSLREYDR